MKELYTNATKSQMIEFISSNFINPEGEHPVKSQLDAFRKDELAEVITNANVENEFEKSLAQ